MNTRRQAITYRYRFIHSLVENLVRVVVPCRETSVLDALECAPRKVLVLKFGGMGEAVLARSLVDRLRERNPSMNFGFLVERRTIETMTSGVMGESFAYSPRIDGIVRAFLLLWKIRKVKYDALIDFEQHSLLTAVFARATSIPVRVGFIPSAPSSRGQMFTHAVELKEDESMWDSFLKIGRVLDPSLPASLMTTPIPVSRTAEISIREWWNKKVDLNARGPMVAVHLGVGPSAQYRRWPVERFLELAQAFHEIYCDTVIVLTGSKSEQQLIADFQVKYSGKSVDATDLGGLDHTAALLRNCDLMVSCDTGIMHLSAAMGTPTVGLFGPNTPVCWAPVGPRATYVYPTLQPCSPCINSYRRHIPEVCTAARESACMWDITVQDVLDAAKRVMQEPWRM